MDQAFQFQTEEVVLAEWSDKLFYAKILHINYLERTCTLLFDDDSVDHCPFSKIHSVTETTAEIVCIVCKDGASCRPNEIVLCDKCGVGYHQKCHNPAIEDKALEPEEPWMCIFCSSGIECPYLLNPFETKLQEDLNSFSVATSRENTKISQSARLTTVKTKWKLDLTNMLQQADIKTCSHFLFFSLLTSYYRTIVHNCYKIVSKCSYEVVPPLLVEKLSETRDGLAKTLSRRVEA